MKKLFKYLIINLYNTNFHQLQPYPVAWTLTQVKEILQFLKREHALNLAHMPILYIPK